MPTGPSVLVLPGTAKSLDQFSADDFECRQFAQAQLGGATPTQAASESGVRSAAVGTAVGAAGGAAIDAGSGAGVGAAERSAYDLQRRYDYGYMQCMYAKGHKIPVPGSFVYSDPATPADYAAPPPPPPQSPSSSH